MSIREDGQPLVSCIMPTADRRAFVGSAVEYFLRQDYEPRELIVVDDGADAVGDLLPRDERVRYVRLNERLTVGAKRNLACEQASGELIAHWDDDDWHAPHRLSYQVATLQQRPSAQVCGINRLLFYDVRDGRAWLYAYPANQRLWLSGSTLCYRRAFWAGHRFAGINVGEDARFVWSGRPEEMIVLTESDFHVGIIHTNNVSPKLTGNACWTPYPTDSLRELFGADWPRYAPEHERKVSVAGGAETMTTTTNNAIINNVHDGHNNHNGHARAARNVFACLVHESQECVVDLVRNLRYLDPDSTVLLYNGGQNQRLLDGGFPFARYGAIVHPAPRPMRWGWLHDFALDCMRYALANFDFDTLTIVDSDQLGVRAGYSQFLGAALGPRLGLLGNGAGVQGAQTRVPPAVQAWREVELWRPFLSRFKDGAEKFVQWTFWPSTVFTADAARDLVRFFDADEELQTIMSRSRIWATEEIVLPTLVALLGYEVAANPCSYEYVKYRQPYTVPQLEQAFTRNDVFWLHPAPRRYDDPLRQHIRARCQHYARPAAHDLASPPPHTPGASSVSDEAAAAQDEALVLAWPVIRQMRQIEGWLEDEEAELLFAVTRRALAARVAPPNVVEVGSYCGRATLVIGRAAEAVAPQTRIYSVDPHDGRVGALDTRVEQRAPTLARFKRNLAAAGLSERVEIVQRTTADLEWSAPVALLVVDGLHDYANVARDFYRFAAHIVAGGYVLFHDYAPYYPGVQTFVDELLAAGRYRKLAQAGSLIALRRASFAAEVDASS
jgi:glycosyltransferase involved in cell wall biosynthesis/predicted O-methyltransferase YrrM